MTELIANVVFTKNRPLQLAGYLESLYRFLPREQMRTHILYKPELFEAEYESVFRRFENCRVIMEKNFHKDLLDILKQLDTKYVLFGIDDVVYFCGVDLSVVYKTFEAYSDEAFGFSFRLGAESVDSCEQLEKFEVGGEQIYSLDWRGGRTADTRYPFELCATMYRTGLIQEVLKGTMSRNFLARSLFSPNSATIRFLGRMFSRRSILKKFGYFYSPNTFESWNCRWCQRHGESLPGRLFFQEQCAAAVQVNMVNVSTRAIFEGEDDFTVHALNEKYKDGYRLDIDFVAAKRPTNPHCGREFLRLRKNN